MGERWRRMREAIGADIRRHRESEALRFKRAQIGEQLIAAHPVEAPESLVEEELDKSLNNYARYLASQGVDLEKAEIDWRKIERGLPARSREAGQAEPDPGGDRPKGRARGQRRRSRRRDPPRRPGAGPRVRGHQTPVEARGWLRTASRIDGPGSGPGSGAAGSEAARPR